MNEIKKILIISHEASLTGAPILVLNLLKQLKQERKNYKIDVFLIRPGELYEDFARNSENKIIVASYYNQSLPFINRNLKKIKDSLIPKKESREKQIKKITDRLLKHNYDLIYANTIESLTWTLPFYRKNIPTIVAIHELAFGIESTYPKEFILDNISNVSMIIAGSKAVAENLIQRYGADPGKITTIHSFVEEKLEITKDAAELKKELNIPESAVVLGIASSQDLRKGTDLVPMLVKMIANRTDTDFRFINMGGSLKTTLERYSRSDAEKLGIEDKIVYVGHNKIPNDYINIFDIFLLLSREDPFPLVMLTAAKLKKPIVAFDQSGGATEFLENDHGFLSPYLDLDTMATHIVRLIENPGIREEYGQKINARLENDYSGNELAQKIFALIDLMVKK